MSEICRRWAPVDCVNDVDNACDADEADVDDVRDVDEADVDAVDDVRVCDVDEVDVNEVGDVKDTGEMDMMNLIRCSVDAKDVGNAM